MCEECIRNEVQGHQNDGSMGTSGVRRGDEGERMLSSEEKIMCVRF